MNMKKTLATAVLWAASAAATAAMPTEESVATLLEVTRAQSLLEQSYAGMEQMVRQGIAQSTAGRALNDEQKRVIELAPARIAAVMKTELSWDAMRPIYVGIYRETFDQAEIDGLIAFYRSPVGQSFVAKMPAVMQRTMGVTQTQMQAVLPKLREAMDQVLREAKLPPRT